MGRRGVLCACSYHKLKSTGFYRQGIYTTVGLNSVYTTDCLKSVQPTPKSHVVEIGIRVNTVFKVGGGFHIARLVFVPV